MEAVGAIASISQITYYLAEASISIYKLYRKLHDAPKAFRRYVSLAEQLQCILRLLKSNQWLQNEAIGILLQSLSHQVNGTLILLPDNAEEAGSLVLKVTGKTRRAFKFLRNEDELKNTFKAIEKMKSSLALCIQDTQVQQAGNASQNTIKLLQLFSIPEEEQSDTSIPGESVEHSSVRIHYRTLLCSMVQLIFISSL